MITMTDFVAAINGCKVAYGVDSVHVSLLAKEMGVGVHEVVEFITGNPGAFSTNNIDSGEREKYGLYINSVITPTYRYGRLVLDSDIADGNSGGTIEITVEGGEFLSKTEIEKVANWIYDAGGTETALDSILYTAQTKVATLTLIGTVADGTITVLVKPTAMKNGFFSEPATLVVEKAPEEQSPE